MIPEQLEQLKNHILDRWRREVRANPEQAAMVAHLDDRELQDHLPALTDKIIQMLRGEPISGLEEDAIEHGQQRYKEGYSVVQLLQEMQIFRQILAAMVYEIVSINTDDSAAEVEQYRKRIINLIDLSMNASVAQYTRAAEEERSSARAEAHALHDQRDRFLVTLSHELRNQVSPILLGVQLLKEVQPPDHRMEQVVERIERQARHQAILIDDLLGISRFRYGKLQLRREQLDLRLPLQQALEGFQSDFSVKQLQVHLEISNRPVMGFADETRLVQVFTNLLNNAIKFTSSGGTISIGLAEQMGSAVFTVRDTGVGISPEVLPQLFTMFFQADAPSTMEKTGLGVGLALARILVEMHGGTIEGQSEGAGRGAVFTVRLPLAESIDTKVSPAAKRVLVVDDNRDHLELLADLLELHGYEVAKAHDASEALRLAEEHKPNACVIDIGLPDMDGYELARKLRQIPETRNSRLIAVTGYGSRADHQAFKEAGFDHYFPKPADLKNLVRALSE
jgi:signal transduction histidine kinase